MINKKWLVYLGNHTHILEAPSAQEACEYFGVYGLRSITKVEEVAEDD